MKKGFTLVELLIAIAISALLLGIGLSRYLSFNQNQTLHQAAQNLRNNLRTAANRAMTGEKPTSGCAQLDGYQVTFTVSSYSIQAKCGVGLAGTATTVTLPSALSLALFPASPTTVLFKVLGSGADSAKAITLSAFGKNEIVNISLSGEVQ